MLWLYVVAKCVGMSQFLVYRARLSSALGSLFLLIERVAKEKGGGR